MFYMSTYLYVVLYIQLTVMVAVICNLAKFNIWMYKLLNFNAMIL